MPAMIDIFDIMGPIMVGPSSSHTAGAVRIGRMARALLGETPVRAALHLYGSVAETGVGHGTDKALIAGLLGMAPDDLSIPLSFTIAEASKASSATDAAIRAVAPYVHNHLIEEAMGDLTGQKLTDATGSLVPVKDEEGTSAEIETQK